MSRAREIADLIGGPTPDIILKTADGAILNLQTSDTTVTDGSVLGAINFTAPNEGSGTDAITIGGAILAVAEGTFSADNNATELVFMTGASEAATSKMVLSSAGLLSIAGGFAASDGSTISTADNTVQLTLISTDADANSGPIMNFYRNSASPAAGDSGGLVEFIGKNDAGQDVTNVQIEAEITGVGDGAEDVALKIGLRRAGAFVDALSFDPTETVFNDTGADVNFRVESDDNVNMLFVNASDDRVGVGTAGPQGRFEVAQAQNAANQFTVPHIALTADATTNSTGFSGISYATSTSTNFGFTVGALRFGSDANPSFVFNVHDNSAAGVEVMRISNLGQVNIRKGAGTRFTPLQFDGLVIQNNDATGIRIISDVGGSNVGHCGIGNDNGELTISAKGGITFDTNMSATAQLFTGANERFAIANNGDLTGTDTSIASNSDERLKENIADYTYDIAKFKQYAPKTFDWINAEVHNGRTGNRGFLAQAVNAIDDKWIGEATVKEHSPDYDIISNNVSLTSKLGDKDAMYISVIQQLITRIETLEAKSALSLEDA